MLVLIFRLDADYLESAAAVSQKLYEKVQQMKQGGGIALPASAKAASIRLPRFPWLGGAGPLAWRQILIADAHVEVSPSSSRLVSASTIAVLAFVGDRNRAGPDFVSFMGVGFMAYLTFIFSMQLPWAFRGDIVHMDCLKSLPVAPLALALGELAGWPDLARGDPARAADRFAGCRGTTRCCLGSVIAFLIPFDLVILAMSNTLFLIYPVRFAPGNSADFQMVGRMMLFMLLQFLLLIPTLGIPAGLGGPGVCADRFPSSGLRHRLMGLARGRVADLALPAGRDVHPFRPRHGDAAVGVASPRLRRQRLRVLNLSSACFRAAGSCR